MNKKYYFGLAIFLLNLCHALSNESSDLMIAYSCPDIKQCSPVNSDAYNLTVAKNNQLSYQCLRKNGDNDMAEIANKAYVACQTIRESVNPIIIKK